MRRTVSKMLRRMASQEMMSRPRGVRYEYRNARYREMKTAWNATPWNIRKTDDLRLAFVVDHEPVEV